MANGDAGPAIRPQLGLTTAVARYSASSVSEMAKTLFARRYGINSRAVASRLREITTSGTFWVRKGILSWTRRGRKDRQLEDILQSTADALGGDLDTGQQGAPAGALRRRRLSVRRTLLIYKR